MSLSPSPALISVIIPTLDRPSLLGEALASVADQEVPGEVEVVVVNDGGTPVGSVVAAWADRLAVALVDNERRKGPGAARNAGVRHAEGKYVAFLDDDDLFLPGHLAAACEPLDRDEADFVYLGAVVADRRSASRPADPACLRLKAYSYDHRLLQVANYLHTGSVVVRNFRNTPVRFDESLDVCEDWDLWLALTDALSYRVSFIDKITSIYHQVPEVPGLVAAAQLVIPSRFSVARDYIQAKWPTDDSLVLMYREWMNALERHRSDLIAKEQRMPNLLFDDILGYLQQRMSHGQAADYRDIGNFFEPE